MRAARDPVSWAVFLTLAIAVLTLDLAVKHWAFSHVAGTPVVLTPDRPEPIPPHQARPIIPHVLSLKLTLNRGAAFGLGRGARWLFVAVAFGAISIITVLFWRSPARSHLLHLALALLLAGAAGNLYDRIAIGSVRDMLWMFPGVKLPFGWRWPGGNAELYPWIFNVADAAMCVALAVLLVLMYRADRRGKESH